MRFLIAAALFVVSIVVLLLGVAERTIWAPPLAYNQTLEIDTAKPLVLVPNEVLSQHPGTPTISVQGAKNAFVASAREADILAWIGNSGYATVGFDEKANALNFRAIEGSENLESPKGSDLWRGQISKEESASLRASTAEEGAVLVASDGVRAAPSQIQIIWPIAHDLFLSNLYLIIGSVILLAAFVMNILAYQHMRKSRGPRRRTPSAPKPPQYKFKRNKNTAPVRGRRSARRAFLALPIAITVLATSAGCSSDSANSPSPSPSASAIEVAPVALLQSQIKNILAEVSKVAADADLTSDKKVLTQRFIGPALEQRTAHYLLRTRSTKIAALPKIVDQPVSFSLPAATDSWPRTLMVVTDEKGDEALPQMLVLQQETPRSKYMLWYNVRLMPGAKIPEVPASETGAIPVEKDSLFLKLAPQDIASCYGDVINKGAASLSFGLFEVADDEFYRQVSESQKSQVKNLSTGKITFSHSLGNKNVISLATSTAGALVAVYMKDTYKIKPKTRGSAVAVSGQEKIMLGADGSTRGVRSIYGDMLLFYVPALSDSEKIRLLGVSQGLISVRSL
ncbi:MAG: hypothetical protein F2599_02615 [Actinobacteria bacterium]|uniref:Unannotated protein n=1 Tax=freshwater metagenome TaxID=449393 RepID=A0A6J6I9N6_9ZZZZ|nr:hypothetical protein [Actinomycetota bacterium]